MSDTLRPTSFETPESSTKEVLNEQQKAILERVIAILEDDKDLNTKVTESFKENVLEIAKNPQLSNRVFEIIGEKMTGELTEIQKRFEDGKLTSKEATIESKEIIRKYTRMNIQFLGKTLTA